LELKRGKTMGYSLPTSGTQWELGAVTNTGNLTLTAASGGSYDVGIIFRIPSTLNGDIIGAYFDVEIPYVINTNALTNYIDDSGGTAQVYIENLTTSAVYNTQLALTGNCRANGASISIGGHLKGWSNLSDVLDYDTLYNVQFRNCKSAQNDLILRNMCGTIRLYLSGNSSHV
jgi:hypothetical protein